MILMGAGPGLARPPVTIRAVALTWRARVSRRLLGFRLQRASCPVPGDDAF